MTSAVARKLHGLFLGLDRKHGRSSPTGKTRADGKAEYKSWTVDGPSTPELWEKHLAGEEGIGIPPLRDDGTVGWAAIDIDIYGGGLDHAALAKRAAELGLPLVVCRSKSGGGHVLGFFKEPAPANRVRPLMEAWCEALGFEAKEIFPKQDQLDEATPNGNWLNMPYHGGDASNRYAIGPDGEKLDVDGFIALAEARRTTIEEAEVLKVAGTKPQPKKKAKKGKKLSVMRRRPIGENRNIVLYKTVCRMIGDGIGEEAIRAEIHERNEQLCDEPLPERELEQTVFKAFKRYESGEELPPLTDMGNAQRFVALHGKNIRHISNTDTWRIFNGTHWADDDTNRIMALARDVPYSIMAEAPEAGKRSDKAYEATLGWAHTSQSKGKLEAMVALAQSEPGIAMRSTDFDVDNMLFNILSGTIELRTMTHREHDRRDYISKVSPVMFDADARADLLMKTFDRILAPEPVDGRDHELAKGELIAFVLRLWGYCLTGLTSEQIMAILYGTGANGKSVLLEIMHALVGDYGTKSTMSTFMERKYDSGPRDDINALQGARLVTAAESGRGKSISETLVKEVTGGDRITARALYAKKFTTFQPQFKLLIATNHKPTIKGQDEAIWRRTVLIPFEVFIPKEDRDKDLVRKLKEELPGILNLVLGGCMAWQKEGLNPPPEVLAATQDYRDEMDIIGPFLKAEYEEDADGLAPCGEMYDSYEFWAEANGQHAVLKTTFGTIMSEKGFKSKTGRVNGKSIKIYPRLRKIVTEKEKEEDQKGYEEGGY